MWYSCEGNTTNKKEGCYELAKSPDAFVNPAVLKWARLEARLSVEAAAKAASVDPKKLEMWEEGLARPTMKQLRKLARKYGQLLAVFYLPTVPESRMPKFTDYRRMPGMLSFEVSPALARELRLVADRRAIALELLSELEQFPKAFHVSASVDDDPEKVGEALRTAIGLSADVQRQWRKPEVGWRQLREYVENAGVLVMQTSRVDVSEVRGVSIAEFPLPVVVTNGNDSYNARIFTLFHELAHIALRTSSICNVIEDETQNQEISSVEVFCNHVAGAALVPAHLILSDDLVQSNPGPFWDDESLAELSRRYCVSQEVIIRRLLTLKRTTKAFYDSKISTIRSAVFRPTKQDGFPAPWMRTYISSGRFFSATVLRACNVGYISTRDAADFLGLRLNHLSKLASLAGVPWAGE